MKKSVLPLVSRRLGNLMFVLSFVFLFSACSESDSVSEAALSNTSYKCPTCKTNPEALPENDNSNKGIYFAITQAGIIAIDVDNQNDGVIKATLNNSTDSEVTFESSHYNEDEFTAIFSGIVNDVPTEFQFIVGTDGSNPAISFFDTSGRLTPSTCLVYKEKSNAMVEVFEGDMMRKFYPSSTGNEPGLVGEGSNSPASYELLGNAMYLFSRAANKWCILKIQNDNAIETDSGRIIGNNLLNSNDEKVGTLVSDEANQEIDLQGDGKLIIKALRVQ